jgi:hypothetical protein
MLVSVLLEIVLIQTQDRCTYLCLTYRMLEKSFLPHPIELLGDVDHVESHFGPFGDIVTIGAR